LHIRALALLCLVRLLLPRAGLVGTLRAVDRTSRLHRPPQPGPRLLSAVNRVARRLVPGSVCLPQAITVTALMRAQGEDPELVLGCRRENEGWTAHAWVELGGRVFDTLRVEQVELARYSASGGWRPRRPAAPERAS